MNKYYNFFYEDDLSYHVVCKILSVHAPSIIIDTSQNCHGFGKIKANVNKWNAAAVKGIRFIVVTDLDSSPCPVKLINEWFVNGIDTNLIFRIAIKEIESWVLADNINFSKFLGISNYSITDSDTINDPKDFLFKLTKKSRYTNIKKDILPLDIFARIGPNYNNRLALFIHSYWDIDNARQKSKSLDRAIKAFVRINNR